MFGVLVHRLQVIQRRGRIRQLTDALVIFALAAPDTAEVKPQHGKAKLVECVMQVIDNLVVHRSAELRMGMKDNGDRGVALFLRMVTAFEAAFGACKNHFGHMLACLFPTQGLGRQSGCSYLERFKTGCLLQRVISVELSGLPVQVNVFGREKQ